MQTFLPYKNFSKTAKILDYRRLGKQRVEAKQILNVLDKGGAWENHPAVLMWSGFEDCLRIYFNIISSEWEKRGYKHNMGYFKNVNYKWPDWIGNDDFHCSHRSNLLRKNPEHYRKYWPVLRDDLEYIWPVKKVLQ